jgi:hypothetical protein
MVAFGNQEKNVWCPQMNEPGSGKSKLLASGLIANGKKTNPFVSFKSVFSDSATATQSTRTDLGQYTPFHLPS